MGSFYIQHASFYQDSEVVILKKKMDSSLTKVVELEGLLKDVESIYKVVYTNEIKALKDKVWTDCKVNYHKRHSFCNLCQWFFFKNRHYPRALHRDQHGQSMEEE